MVRFLLSLLLLVAFAVPPAFAEDAPVFSWRYMGDGVRLRDANENEALYPININNWWGLMNKRGELIVFPHYDWADYSYDGATRVVLDGRTGFINNHDQWIIQPIYRWADRFSGGLAVVSDGKTFGFINTEGREVTPLEYDGALRFSEGLAAVMQTGRCGFIDTRGQTAVPMHFAKVRSFHEGLAMVQLPDRGGRAGSIGYIDRSGQMVFEDTERKFSDLGSFREGLASAQVDGKWGFINREFEVVIEPIYDDVRDFVGGFAAVELRGKWGYIDKAGETAIGPQYEKAGDFDEILAMVRIDGKYGYINRNAKPIIAPQFDEADPYFRNYARVRQNSIAKEPIFGYIGLVGNVVWDPRAAVDVIIDSRFNSHGRPPGAIQVSQTEFKAPAYRRPVAVPYDNSEYVEVLPQTNSSRDRGRSRRYRR